VAAHAASEAAAAHAGSEAATAHAGSEAATTAGEARSAVEASAHKRPMADEGPVRREPMADERPVHHEPTMDKRPVPHKPAMHEEGSDEDAAPEEATVVRSEPMMPPARSAVDLISYSDVVDRSADTGRIAKWYRIRPVRQRTRSQHRRCCRDSRDDLPYHDVSSICCQKFQLSVSAPPVEFILAP
jgi:hypothetical protein